MNKLLVIAMIWLVSAAPGLAAELIMLEQDNCEYCERWNDDIGVIYHKTQEGKSAPLRRVNIHQALPSDLANLNKGRYTPTFVLFDKGREVGRIRGYPGEDFFWGLLSKLLEKLPEHTKKAG